MNEQGRCQDKEALLAVLYGEGTEAERQDAEAHVAACAACAAELEDLRGVRETLARWTPPARDFGFRIVRDPAVNADRQSWWARPIPVWAQVAAAVLLLSVGAAIANLDIRYGPDGFTVATGWQRQPVAPVQAATGVPPADPALPAPWKTDLAALEQQLRSEFARQPAVAEPVTAPAGRALDETRLLRQVQALIAASEDRQRRELALRNLQLARDLRLDLAQLQRGLVQLDGRSGAEAAQNREILNYLMRVSQIK